MFFVGITGASGTSIGIKLTSELLKTGNRVSLCFSEPAKLVAATELLSGSFSPDEIKRLISDMNVSTDGLELVEADYLDHDAASGSSGFSAVFVCPCSMSTLARIAYGTGTNLIHRAADVALKERKKLILVPRETPLSLVHLRAMVAAAEAGAVIVPPSPAFYPSPESIDDVINFIVGKVLDVAGIDNNLYRRWKSSR